MKFAICECGARIIVVPDLLAVAKTVYIHAAIHKMFETNPDKAEAERSRIEIELKHKIIKELISRRDFANDSKTQVNTNSNPKIKIAVLGASSCIFRAGFFNYELSTLNCFPI